MALEHFGRRALGTVAGVLAWALASAALAAGGTVYWLAPRSNVIIDQQVAATLGPDAGLVVLRASWKGPQVEYDLSAMTRRFKAAGADKVLAYAWGNRYAAVGRAEADLFQGLDIGRPIVQRDEQGIGKVAFLDITDKAMRARIIARFVEAKKTLGVDGFALDLSHRTPTRGPIAKRCTAQLSLCPNYAQGMDALYAELRQALGRDTYIAFNGLFNFSPGQIEDQALLLRDTNAAAIEYFGMDPNGRTHSFSKDVLPFLRAVQKLPADRQVLFFGRGTWDYVDYAEDYRWQRYLYASFLLAARGGDLFKYHASFQVPAHKGRTGGMDRFADWRLELGAARGPMVLRDGLFVREFAQGVVVVAPEEGGGSSYRTSRARYTPEGEKFEGSVSVPAGTGLILLDVAPEMARRAARSVITSADMAGWGWTHVDSDHSGPTGALTLRQLPPELTGEHDVLLDGERSLMPYDRLELRVGPRQQGSRILLVAEVDDRDREHTNVVFEVGGARGGTREGASVPFRSTYPREREPQWPWVGLPGPRGDEPLVFDGPQLLEGTGLQFRRWSHVRFEGQVSVQEIALSRPHPPLATERRN